MEGKIKKAVGIALLIYVALTGLGLAATPALAVDTNPPAEMDFTGYEDSTWGSGGDSLVIYLDGYDDPVSQTCVYTGDYFSF